MPLSVNTDRRSDTSRPFFLIDHIPFRALQIRRSGGEGEEGEGGGVLPKGLTSGSGHHRLKIFGPSNGRHTVA